MFITDFLSDIIRSVIFSSVKFLFHPFVLFVILSPAIAALVYFGIEFIIYKNSTYYADTKLSYLHVRNDFGRYGEFLTYKQLRRFEKNGAKFLFNVYIPKNNDETTEIDVLMICKAGLIVFESKNYSGWIFGSEDQRYWYQTLPRGRGKSHKERFYNPVMQNNSHITHLKTLLGDHFPMQSIIVFSDRCELKNITMQTATIPVIQRRDVVITAADILTKADKNILSNNDINELYTRLCPFSQVDDSIKAKHIEQIQKTHKPQSKSHRPIETATEKSENQSWIPSNPIPEQQNAPAEVSSLGNSDHAISPVHDTRQFETTDHRCPRCGGTLVIRTTRRGTNIGTQFFGCSNFPKCKYTQSYHSK